MMALECMDMVSVRYVNSAAEFGNPDAVILPGSKNTMEDILWMRQNGLEDENPRNMQSMTNWYLVFVEATRCLEKK